MLSRRPELEANHNAQICVSNCLTAYAYIYIASNETYWLYMLSDFIIHSETMQFMLEAVFVCAMHAQVTIAEWHNPNASS